MVKCNTVKIALLLLVFGLNSIAISADHFRDWQASMLIQSHGDQRYKSLFLNEQVYRYSMPDLRDIRLVDDKGEAVPYCIEEGFQVIEKSEVEYQTFLIKTFRKKRDSYFDFKVIRHEKLLDTPGNRLVIVLPECDFYKEIEIHGSYDGDSWEYLGREPFYRVNGLKKDSFIMPQTEKYLFYRFKVLNNAEAIELNRLSLFDSRLRENWKQFRRKTQLSYKNEVKGNWSVLTIENPNKLHFCRINIKARGNFERNYELVESDPERLLQSGQLYQLSFKSNPIKATDIALSDVPVMVPRLKLKIDNQDNRPVDITQIEALYTVDKLIFEATGSRTYHLWFGNPNAKRPHYDLENYQEQLLKEKQDTLVLSNITAKNKGLAASRAQLKKYFNIVVIIVALVLMFLLWMKLKGNMGEKGSAER